MDIQNISPDSLGIITRAELDMSISTAKAYPRDLNHFLNKTIQDATKSQAIAEKCTYSLPRKQKGKDGTYRQVMIEGASVHLARICCSNFQNIKVAVRIISNNGREIVAQGVCIDMENNYTASIEVKRSIINSSGQTYSEDMQTITSNAACAIAFRNVVFQVIPSAYITPILEKVKEVAKGTEVDMDTRRANCLAWYKKQGISELDVCNLAGVFNISEIGLEELFILRSIQEGHLSGEMPIHSVLNQEGASEEAKAGLNQSAKEAYASEENGAGGKGNGRAKASNMEGKPSDSTGKP